MTLKTFLESERPGVLVWKTFPGNDRVLEKAGNFRKNSATQTKGRFECGPNLSKLAWRRFY